MRKVLTSLALGCALAAALTVAASACDYQKQTSASAQQSDQTAQAQPAASNDNN